MSETIDTPVKPVVPAEAHPVLGTVTNSGTEAENQSKLR